MIKLLGALRREMNGAVADGMYVYGRPCGLNYGVSLPTIRAIARAEGCDHSFARYLYRQQVRELRLAALHIADPAAVDDGEARFWAEGIINSEIAEEAAFALLRRSPAIGVIFAQWCGSGNEFLAYSALMAAARGAAADTALLKLIPEAVAAHPDSRIIAQGAVALLSAAFQIPEARQTVTDVLEPIRSAAGTSYAAGYITGEMEWRTYQAPDSGE